jgi:siderophore synthetase component
VSEPTQRPAPGQAWAKPAPPQAEESRTDAASLANSHGVGVLLRCWVREHGVPVSAGAPAVIDLPALGAAVTAHVGYASSCGWHRFGDARLVGARSGGPPLSAPALAALLAEELAARTPDDPGVATDLVGRVVDSVRRVEAHIAHRLGHPPDGVDPFLDAERALVAGHPFHPTPKSREGLAPADGGPASPELDGSFALHWFAVERSRVALGGDGHVDPARRLAAVVPRGLTAPAGTVLVPAHPWQARHLRARPAVRALIDAGDLYDLGPAGPPWCPTSSLRTLYRPGAGVMLKVSLGVRITNSRRANRPDELRLAAQASALLAAGVGADLAAAHPAFGVVGDPAWATADLPGGVEGGVDLALRDVPFGPADRATCVAALVDEHPGATPPIVDLLTGLAAVRGEPVPRVAAAWLARYLDVAVAPVLWLHAAHGVMVEAHHQNTLVGLDGDGWPVRGWYRDGQGWYVASSAEDATRRRCPVLGAGTTAYFPDDLVLHRLLYYVGVNNVLGLVGALGAFGLADEADLLAVVRNHLVAHPSPAAAALLGRPTLPVKANLLTTAEGADEVAAPSLDRQSVYVEMRNPLVVRGAEPSRCGGASRSST